MVHHGNHYENKYQVIVIGGGTAGVIAALQAARAGARTALFESNGMLGGTMTSGGVAFPGLFHAWGKQIIAGIGWEMVLKSVALSNHQLPDFTQTPPRHWHHQIPLDGSVYACVLEEACLEAGVNLHYYETAISGRKTAAGWQLRTVGKGPMQRTVTCQELIDCTGDADIVGMLGYPRMRDEECQPGTLMFRFAGYDIAALDHAAIEQAYHQALDDGSLREGDVAHAQGRFTDFLAAGGSNQQHIFLADSSTAVGKTSANIRGRQSLLRLLRFVRRLPGCEQAYLADMSTETGIRETYRIVGETMVTADDYVSGRVFPDAVGYSFYPIDLHHHTGIDTRPLPTGVAPTIPLGALIPKGSRNLLVAGRCIASDRPAHSALRVQASCMAMGQAVGAAAALAAQQRIPSREVALTDIRHLLTEHGAIVP
ncbi:MAG TPA: FAD-dependent oxidoreductase [Armatimonadota bacterium]|nr:FAD-dependent oxidoreductase [Armatimonadota bacterium]